MHKSPFRIVQISDIHLYADKETALLGVKTYESFTAVLDLVKSAAPSPHLILLTGDLAQDHSAAAYQHVVAAFKAFSIPIHYVPGNHDDIKLMESILPSASISNVKQIVLEQWQIILLNSQKSGTVEGYLARSQLEFLETCLQQYPAHRAIVVFHHHPIATDTAWLDNVGLQNADELWATLGRYPQTHTVLFGHVHQEFQGEKNGIKYFSTPSTCIQFKGHCASFALDHLPPAYRWIDLYSNGELKTAVCRAAQYIGVFDAEAKGY